MLRFVHVVRWVQVRITFIVLALLALPHVANAASKPSVSALAAITARGRILAEYDEAAWKSTDAMMAAHPKAGQPGRYIPHKTAAGWVVEFGRLNVSGDKFLVAYEVVQTGSMSNFSVTRSDRPREDTGWNLAAAKGVDTAMRTFHGADRPYNVAVLPAGSAALYVYFYLAQVKKGIYPIGADVRYRVSLDGSKILEAHQMHKSIIESLGARADAMATSSYHTHILSDLPEDTDVMMVLTRQPRVPEIVVTPSYMYSIDVSGQITVAERPKRN